MRTLLVYTLLFFSLAACGDDALFGILPSISSISSEKGKAEGPISGKTKVTIRGTHFSKNAEVTFGAKKATTVSFQNENTLLATTDSVFHSALVSVAVTSGGQIVVKPGAFVYTPLIAFASNRTGSFEIFTMEIDGDTPTRLTTSGSGVINESPVFSPDGKNILFSTKRTGDFELFLMRHDGFNPVNLTNHNGVDQSAVFSPDGTQIVFISNRLDVNNPEGDFEIFLMDQDGSNLKQLTSNNTPDRDPSFSHDGTRILFSSGPDGNRELFLMNTDGTGLPQPLTINSIDDHDPSFSPDGKQIIFVSNRSGDNELHIMDSDGQNTLPLTTNQDNVADPVFLEIPNHGIEVLLTSSDPQGTNRNSEVFWLSCAGDQTRAVTNCDEAGRANLSLHTASDIHPSTSP